MVFYSIKNGRLSPPARGDGPRSASGTDPVVKSSPRSGDGPLEKADPAVLPPCLRGWSGAGRELDRLHVVARVCGDGPRARSYMGRSFLSLPRLRGWGAVNVSVATEEESPPRPRGWSLGGHPT